MVRAKNLTATLPGRAQKNPAHMDGTSARKSALMRELDSLDELLGRAAVRAKKCRCMHSKMRHGKSCLTPGCGCESFRGA